MLAASDGSRSRSRTTRRASRARAAGSSRRRLITSTFASFHFRAPAGGLGVGAQRGAHAGDLVGGDRRAGAGPAEQHAGLGRAGRHRLADAPTDLGPLPVLAGRRPDQHDVGAARLEVVPHGIGQRRCARRIRARLSPRGGYAPAPCPYALRHDLAQPGLGRVVELGAVLVGQLERVDRCGLGRGDRRGVHVHAGIGERDAQRVQEARAGPPLRRRSACATASRGRRT